MLKGEKRFGVVVNAGTVSLSHTEGGNAKSFHPVKASCERD